MKKIMPPIEGRFNYVPYDAKTKEEYFGPPEERFLPIHDLREELYSSDFPYDLDTHGFTAVKHASILSSEPYDISSWSDRDVLERLYYPEITSLLQDKIGAEKVMILGGTLRTLRGKNPGEDAAPKSQAPDRPGKGTAKFDATRPRIHGVEAPEAQGPAPKIHVDYSRRGAAAMIRNWRQDIIDEARDVIDAEDQGPVTQATARRYAIYSIWRPLEPVKRDPLAFIDGRSFDPSSYAPIPVKTVGASGSEFTVEVLFAKAGAPPGDKCHHRWFWISDQQPDEVCMLKLFDSKGGNGSSVMSAPHGPFYAPGMENELPRKSLEVRLLAFW